jgi:hypothetical protein
LHSKDRSPAPPGKDADPPESLWDFKGREAKPVARPQAETVRRQAAISDRSKGVRTCGREHYFFAASTT